MFTNLLIAIVYLLLGDNWVILPKAESKAAQRKLASAEADRMDYAMTLMETNVFMEELARFLSTPVSGVPDEDVFVHDGGLTTTQLLRGIAERSGGRLEYKGGYLTKVSPVMQLINSKR